MIARLKDWLKVLRWSEEDLAEELGCEPSDVRTLFDGRRRPPLALMAWLETLVKIHKTLPCPRLNGPINATATDMETILLAARPLSLPALREAQRWTASSRRSIDVRYSGARLLPSHRPLQTDHTTEHVLFESPVAVFDGMGVPTMIGSVTDACKLLQDWPAASRNGTHMVALNACKAAAEGVIDGETARTTFIAFARRNNILVPETVSLSASRRMGSLPGQTTGRNPIRPRLPQPGHEKLEEVMNKNFDSPVYVRDGAITLTIDDISGALAFMSKWPTDYRGVVFETVRWGFYAAHQGRLSVETAQKSFKGWARALGILVESPGRSTHTLLAA
ncbi:DUF982 domain-containing protein [Pseudaminobacter arsenicus]|uniref:DUF982 domain-containing protein n=1 Tax=Borborobacter arsenicus TaxID=1851146 RepID=A0A432UZB9_9HYPH|nr:DUF982 domain-containing protein [Pseudaminobacter arsenicus]